MRNRGALGKAQGGSYGGKRNTNQQIRGTNWAVELLDYRFDLLHWKGTASTLPVACLRANR
jgi:hypothetical protein